MFVDDDTTSVSYLKRELDKRRTRWSLFVKDMKEAEFVERRRDADYIYADRGHKSKTFLGIRFTRDTYEEVRIPLYGGYVEKMEEERWSKYATPVDTLGELESALRHLQLPPSSFQQITESNPRSWVHVFEFEDDMDDSFNLTEIKRTVSSIFLKLPAGNHEVVLPRQGGVAQYKSSGGENTKELYTHLSTWDNIRKVKEVEDDGRNVIYTNVSLNEGRNAVRVYPGDYIQLNFDWEVSVNEEGGCATCFIQFYIGIKDEFSNCFLTDELPPKYYKGRSGKASEEFAAPSAPGLYYLTQRSAKDYACKEDATLHSNSSQDAIAAIWVMNPPEQSNSAKQDGSSVQQTTPQNPVAEE